MFYLNMVDYLSPFGTDFDWIWLGWDWALGVWDLGRGFMLKNIYCIELA